MPNLIHVYDEEIYGEIEGFYDADTGELIHEWNCNDASWRGEYLEAIFEHYGFVFLDDPKDIWHTKFQEYLKETYADDINYQDEFDTEI